MSTYEGDKLIRAGFDRALERDPDGTPILTVINKPTGAGGSEQAREWMRASRDVDDEGREIGELAGGGVICSNTIALALQQRERLTERDGTPELLANALADIPGRSRCVRLRLVRALYEAGLSAQAACATCKEKKGCDIADGWGDTRPARARPDRRGGLGRYRRVDVRRAAPQGSVCLERGQSGRPFQYAWK
jgi:hypothetical protein